MVLFRVMWNMASMFSWLIDSISHRQADQVDSQRAGLVAVPASSPIRRLVKETPSPAKLQFVSDSPSSEDLTDVEFGDMSRSCDSEQDEVGSEASSLQPEDSAHSAHDKSIQKMGKWKFSHFLAISFVKTVQYQCRVENLIRDLSSNRSSQLNQGVYAKRKNSSVALPSPDIPSRNRNRCTDSLSILAPIMDGSVSPPITATVSHDSRVMRRNQITSPDVF